MLTNEEQVNLTITYAMMLGGTLIDNGSDEPFTRSTQWTMYSVDSGYQRRGSTPYVAAARYLEQVCGFYLHSNGTLMRNKSL